MQASFLSMAICESVKPAYFLVFKNSRLRNQDIIYIYSIYIHQPQKILTVHLSIRLLAWKREKNKIQTLVGKLIIRLSVINLLLVAFTVSCLEKMTNHFLQLECFHGSFSATFPAFSFLILDPVAVPSLLVSSIYITYYTYITQY